jgi:xanthine dehydrogenase small subunit
MREKITFYLNGKRHCLGPQESSLMLSEYLRYNQSLTGTKVVCAEGDCGACTVLKYSPMSSNGFDSNNYLPINSCISLIAQLDGASLVTVDALKTSQSLHPAQQSMVACHASQCGFCTPGFVMAITGLVEEKLSKNESKVTRQEAKNCMTGNLCRCTGYDAIIDSVLDLNLNDCESIKSRFFNSEQEKDLLKTSSESVYLKSDEFEFFAPTQLSEALKYLSQNEDAKILGSGTDLGVIHNKRKIKLQKILSLHLIKELYKIEEINNTIKLGSRVTVGEFRHFIKGRIQTFSSYLDVFASPQIKNSATIIGNIATASPIGDTPPAFLALDAVLEIASETGLREIPLSDFFISYRKTKLKSNELITALKFDVPNPKTVVNFYKISNRKDLDISAVNMSFKLEWADPAAKEIKDISIAAGGVAEIPLRFKKTELFLKNKILTKAVLDSALKELHREFTPISDLRATATFRRVIVENLFNEFFHDAGGLK